MNKILPLGKLFAAYLPFLFLMLRNGKVALSREKRSSQMFMPLVALIYSIGFIILLQQALGWCRMLMGRLTDSLNLLVGVAGGFSNLAAKLADLIENNAQQAAIVTLNTLALTIFLIVKRVALPVMQALWKPGAIFFEKASAWAYEPIERNGREVWYLKESMIQARRYLKTFYVTACVLSLLLLMVSSYFYTEGILQTPFFPVLGIILIGEVYLYLNGIAFREAGDLVEGESDSARSSLNYSIIRKVLRGYFGDKLLNENTTINNGEQETFSADDLIAKYKADDRRIVETYGKFLDRYRLENGKLDRNYMESGYDLLCGKSILFNNPFYYDLIPYAFYSMNHKLLNHKKVLVILGRHGMENDVLQWLNVGLRKLTNVEGMWRVGVLSGTEQTLDVGIITRSGVQDLSVHRGNSLFFEEVEYVVLIEPSKLVSTAQIGLNSLIRYCRAGGEKKITFCSTDKNCDGLVDALSHALMTSISEVSSTEAHEGTVSYMNWQADGEHWIHRLLPNIARYLGCGTEISFAALKYDISKTTWYGGDKFPVTDMHWIAKQYYGELLSFAGLPVSQGLLDEVFEAKPNLWEAKKEEKAYITAEDEANNVFEVKREFSTRTTDQNFINVISSPYLLCDYMTENSGIFDTDPKAVPYIVADYTLTKRNILLRLCVQMAAGFVWEADVRKELLMAGISDESLVENLWQNLCACYNPVSLAECRDLLVVEEQRKRLTFTSAVIRNKKRYNVATGREETAYFINDETFIHFVLGDMSNARYFAEEENEDSFLGTESRGMIFQKYLPGQFFTICGKYYEMLRVTYDGRVQLRRAADHITGRPAYRQVRQYTIHAFAEDNAMGSRRETDGIKVNRLYADLSVATSAYWEMPSYNDFAHARRVSINDIPLRCYNNKWILELSFTGLSGKVRYTLASLFNEVFRTIFAENQDMIVAVVPGEESVPLTYGLSVECEREESAIYIIEDCQYDIGLLTAVERNLTRIYQTVCDYLEWNQDAIRKSVEKQSEEPKSFRLFEMEQKADIEDLKKSETVEVTENTEEDEEAIKSKDSGKTEEAVLKELGNKKGFLSRLFEKLRSLIRKKPEQNLFVENKEETAQKADAGEVSAMDDVAERSEEKRVEDSELENSEKQILDKEETDGKTTLS